MLARNHFLASLSAPDLAAITPEVELVSLERDELIAEAGRRLTAAYLPIDCILSVITVMEDGSQIESRTIGRESGHGLLHALGSPLSHERMICQVAGRAARIGLSALSAAARERPSLARAIAQHAQVSMVQSIQAIACNTLHHARPRMARWLLMTQDRLDSDVLPLTQEHLAVMLGVQRTTATVVAQELQEEGLITYRRGKITVRDREGLLRATCECYDAVEETVHSILSEARGPAGDPTAGSASRRRALG
jgi:CRP-like cAMP-binding protein